MIKSPSMLFRVLILITIVVTFFIISCVTTPEKERIPDAALPVSPTVTADITKLYLKPEKPITLSKYKKKANSLIVVIGSTGEATKIIDKGKYERLVRRVLLQKDVKVITGEVRARIEEYKQGGLQSRKETLEEAEKLILLGKETGADAILVFDYIGMAEVKKDIFININPDTEQITITVKGITSNEPDPAAIRKILPALIVRGKLVDAETASISAEFDLVTYFFKNEQELQSHLAKIDKYRYEPVTKSDFYYASQGCCSQKTVEYSYIASYEPIDIQKETTSRILDKYIPHLNEIDTVKADKKLEDFLQQVINEII